MDKEQENKTEDTTTVPLYPEPTKGSLADDHSNYGKDVKFAGGDPDKHVHLYFFGFILLMCFLFIVAVQAVSGVRFIF